MRGRHVLDPAEVNDVVNVILPVDVGRQNRHGHFESRIADHKSEIGFQAEPFHEFLPDLHLQVRLQTAQDFFATLRVHGREIAHQFVARLIFRVLARSNTDRDERGDNPNRDISSTDHGGIKK